MELGQFWVNWVYVDHKKEQLALPLLNFGRCAHRPRNNCHIAVRANKRDRKNILIGFSSHSFELSQCLCRLALVSHFIAQATEKGETILTRLPEPVSTTYAPFKGVCVRTKGIERYPVKGSGWHPE